MVQGQRERRRQNKRKRQKYKQRKKGDIKEIKDMCTVCPRGLAHMCRVCCYIQLGTTSWAYSTNMAEEIAREREQERESERDIEKDKE